jgi:hypothetical protein
VQSCSHGSSTTGTLAAAYRSVTSLSQHVEVQRSPRPAGCLVQPGQQQQVVDQPAEPLDVDQHVAGQLAGRRTRVDRRGDLELGACAGQRRAQLVRGVRDERALPGAGRVQPGQHVVERLGEPADLVLRGRHRQPARAR